MEREKDKGIPKKVLVKHVYSFYGNVTREAKDRTFPLEETDADTKKRFVREKITTVRL